MNLCSWFLCSQFRAPHTANYTLAKRMGFARVRVAVYRVCSQCHILVPVDLCRTQFNFHNVVDTMADERLPHIEVNAPYELMLISTSKSGNL